MEGGVSADIAYLLRRLLHIFLIVMLCYMLFLFIALAIFKRIQRYAGQYNWIVNKLCSGPWGSLFFEAGEFADCAICYNGIWIGQKCVALTCNEKHVYHEECLMKQIRDEGNKYCVLCPIPVKAAAPPTQ